MDRKNMSDVEKKYTLKQLRGAYVAGKKDAEKETPSIDPHIGLWCHTLKAGRIDRQGKIIDGSLELGYRVQWFSWVDGNPTTVSIVHLLEMENWLFYPTSTDMVNAWVSSISP